MTTDKVQETAILSNDPARAMQEMMQTIDALRLVYAEETLALQAADTPAFFALQDRKIETTQEYHDRMSAFINRKDEIIAVQPNLKNVMRKKQEEFSVIASANRDALDRMRRSVTRLGKRITDAASQAAARGAVNYGAHGQMNNLGSNPVTMGINESA